jgi:ribosomal protein S12 methylthiotransferase accessory factor
VELNQILPIVNVSKAERARGKYRIQDKQFLDWLNIAAMENQPYLAPLEKVPVKKPTNYPRLCKPTIYDSLDFCLEATQKHGLETLILDLTRPDIELPVVKVIVPGMRHFWKRLAPGRLYDIPVKMGWLDIPLKEEELNSIGLFI